jgi:DnaK suppressor protein
MRAAIPSEMNLPQINKLLQRKERDLLTEIATLENEGQRSEGPDVGDRVDLATTEVQTNDDVGQGEVVTKTLAQVRDALRRIDAGTYGRCAVCGHQIEASRLEAIPWTPYCFVHREKESPAESEAKVPVGPWGAD